MSVDFISRMFGMSVFAVLGARFGLDLAPITNLPAQTATLIFGLLGALIGLILTPWLTVRPVRSLSRAMSNLTVEVWLVTLLGVFIGLVIGLLLAYPLSLLGNPLGTILPAAISIVSGYLLGSAFAQRSRELWDALVIRSGSARVRLMSQSTRQVLVDTSALIDGRIVGITESGFLNGTIVVPRFVLAELHHVADSSDMLRRNRGRRGLNKLNDLQRSDLIVVKIVEDDFEDIPQVDNKLVALAQKLEAAIVTNDYNLNKVASAQGVQVLNVNALANEVKSVYIPGEAFLLHIIQEGNQSNQGVGYLEDGTMVVVEHGRQFMDRTIKVIVTRLINRDTGRIIFAVPEGMERRNYAELGDTSDDA
ncbi:MAG: PIN domain nuclease [Anaerolineae bacterium]|jgi:uncharacterized protein YacL|nr:PIN domain nuclease [Anaerolineae bacterium]